MFDRKKENERDKEREQKKKKKKRKDGNWFFLHIWLVRKHFKVEIDEEVISGDQVGNFQRLGK